MHAVAPSHPQASTVGGTPARGQVGQRRNSLASNCLWRNGPGAPGSRSAPASPCGSGWTNADRVLAAPNPGVVASTQRRASPQLGKTSGKWFRYQPSAGSVTALYPLCSLYVLAMHSDVDRDPHQSNTGAKPEHIGSTERVQRGPSRRTVGKLGGNPACPATGRSPSRGGYRQKVPSARRCRITWLPSGSSTSAARQTP